MRILKKGNINTKLLAYTAQVRPILEYEAGRCDPYREVQVKWVQHTAAKFANYINEVGWETLAQRRLIARICTHFKAYTRGRIM